MTTVSQLELLIEQNYFEQARSLGLELLTVGEPSQSLVAGFITANNEACLEALRAVATKHPDSSNLLLSLVLQLIAHGRAEIAWLKCSEGLRIFTDIKRSLLFRVARLKAAAKSGKSDFLIEDFLFMRSCDLPGAKQMLKRVVFDLASSDKSSLIEPLSLLATNSEIEPQIRKIFQHKVEELQLLSLLIV